MLLTSVLLGGCSTSVHFKDKKGICLGLCVYSETEATQEAIAKPNEKENQ